MKDLGKLSHFLVIKIVQNENQIALNQSSYDYNNCKPVSTLGDIFTKLLSADRFLKLC